MASKTCPATYDGMDRTYRCSLGVGHAGRHEDRPSAGAEDLSTYVWSEPTVEAYDGPDAGDGPYDGPDAL